MKLMKPLAFAAALAVSGPVWAQTPAAIFTDPPRNAAAPARMEVVQIPSADADMNGVVYVAAGAGPHPTVILMHGLPGNEKNLDLAQDLRRAGWTVVTFNYRGSWGSPGAFSFGHVLGDAQAALAFARTPARAAELGIDPARIVLIGHSMGGWATLLTAGRQTGLMGVVGISAADMGGMGASASPDSRDQVVRSMEGNMTSLSGTTPVAMADELIAQGRNWTFATAATGLARTPLLLVESDDGFGPSEQALAAAVKTAGGKVQETHIATDHSYSDSRIALATTVLNWLSALPVAPKP